MGCGHLKSAQTTEWQQKRPGGQTTNQAPTGPVLRKKGTQKITLTDTLDSLWSATDTITVS
jgi:hypothetical protein